MSSTADEKLIERVRKLYAMAQDSSSPHEAAIAARRARALMDEHGISLESLKRSEFGRAVGHESYSKMPRWYSMLAVAVARYNDCQAQSNGITVVFEGFDIDAQSAALMLDYLVQAMNRQLKQAPRASHTPARRFNNAFRVGFADDMCQRLSELSKQRDTRSDAKALVPVKNQLVAEHFGVVRYQRTRGTVSDGSGYRAGQRASQNTSLNSQVGGSARAQIR